MAFIEKVQQLKKSSFKGVIFTGQFNLQHYNDNLVFSLLGHKLDPKLQNAVNKRKAEFVAGRYIAKCCLQQHGVSTTQVPIGTHRAPIWPENIIGSIAHTNNNAICVTTEKSVYRYLGIDIEPILSEKIAQQITKTVLLSTEYHLVSVLERPAHLIVTLIFSIKESLFKALYPEVQQYFDFDTAQVLEIDFFLKKNTTKVSQITYS